MPNLLQAQRERVGQRIREARIDSKLSHDALALRVGTSRQHLIKLEKAIHLPRPEMLAKIAAETGKPEAFFIDEARREQQEAGDSDDEDSREMVPLYIRRASFEQIVLDLLTAHSTFSRGAA